MWFSTFYGELNFGWILNWHDGVLSIMFGFWSLNFEWKPTKTPILGKHLP